MNAPETPSTPCFEHAGVFGAIPSKVREWVVDALVLTALTDIYEKQLLKLEREHMDLMDKLAEVREKLLVLQEDYASVEEGAGAGGLFNTRFQPTGPRINTCAVQKRHNDRVIGGEVALSRASLPTSPNSVALECENARSPRFQRTCSLAGNANKRVSEQGRVNTTINGDLGE